MVIICLKIVVYFPGLFMMLLSLLVCEYIEEYVAKHLCAWKNRRRRGLRSFYHDFREPRDSHNVGAIQHYSSRTRSYSAAAWVGGSGDGPGENMLVPEGTVPFPASAPPSERAEYYGAQLTTSYPAISPLLSANDPPPSYEECILPRVRLSNPNENTTDSKNGNGNTILTTPPKKPSMKKSSSTEKEK
ncbi:hypothetical protein Ocin01_00315 [Orchesella cincta]|uniref:Uncharacterized protein n=1 Tax=Orchesella cincta TaxID=48709 RepID=A0A1D2NMC5_ORCCI|nr:hypothetical protein Ocin01_00315 [Orchesella cincta]